MGKANIERVLLRSELMFLTVENYGHPLKKMFNSHPLSYLWFVMLTKSTANCNSFRANHKSER